MVQIKTELLELQLKPQKTYEKDVKEMINDGN
jgi:hypothetical protein